MLAESTSIKAEGSTHGRKQLKGGTIMASMFSVSISNGA